MSAEWDLDALLGYIGTWSAVRQYQARYGADPLPALRESLGRMWDPGTSLREVRWPLRLLVGCADDGRTAG